MYSINKEDACRRDAKYDKTDLSGESMMQVFRCNCFRNGKAYDDSSHWQREFVCEGVGKK